MNRVASFLGVVCLVAWFCLAGLPASLWARPTLPRIPGSLPPTVLYFEPLTPLVIKPQRPPQHPEGEERTTVSFVAFAKHFALELELNDIFAPGAETLWIDNGTVRKEAPQAIFYKGRVTGEPDSWVRVSIHNGVLSGMIRTKKDLYFIEPGKRFFAGSSPYSMVIYRLSDTVSDWEPGSCALELPAVQSEMERHGTTADDGLLAEYRALVTELQQTLGPAALASSSGTFEQIALGMVADYEYYQKHGANSAADMQNIINQIDGIYRAEAGVTLKIAKTVVFTNSNDPFSNTTDPTKLLPEFSTYKNTSSSPIYSTGLAHLFTGRDLDGSTVGIAWLDTLCEQYHGTGLSQDYTTNNKSLVLLTAHEIGHNFSAPHDNESGSACASTPFGFIMNPALSQDLQLKFSDCSKGFINTATTAATCMTTVSFSATFTGWTPLPIGGATAAGPTAAIYNDELQVIVRGSGSSAIYHTKFNGSSWAAWQNLGGATPSEPAAVEFNGDLWVFVRGMNDRLYRNRLTGQTWSGWSEVPGGGMTPSGPAATVFNNTLYLFVRGTNSRLYQNRFNGSTWTGWSEVPGGGMTLSGPAAVVFENTLYLVVQGTNNRLYDKLLTSTGWTSWAEVPGSGQTPAAPAATVFNGELWYLVRGLNDRVYQNRLTVGTNGTWSGWKEVTGNGLTPSRPGAAATVDRLHLLMRGTNNQIYLNQASLGG